MNHPLDNIAWQTLADSQARFAVGTGAVRRYAPGFSPIVGFAEAEAPDFDALTPFCEPGEAVYCIGWTGPVPAGWDLLADATMHRMVWSAPVPEQDPAPDASVLGPADADQALALAALTRPGPFGPRTLELGDYFGYFERGHLIGMAGERMSRPGFREVSGVCTHPGQQGKGLARRLMLKLVRRQLLRGETPFLHVMCSNPLAHGLYQRMGFSDVGVAAVRVLARLP